MIYVTAVMEMDAALLHKFVPIPVAFVPFFDLGRRALCTVHDGDMGRGMIVCAILRG